jgi:hypothetical protein
MNRLPLVASLAPFRRIEMLPPAFAPHADRIGFSASCDRVTLPPELLALLPECFYAESELAISACILELCVQMRDRARCELDTVIAHGSILRDF